MVLILQRKFADTSNLNTEVKMFNLFDKFNCSKRVLQLELTIEHQQQQMDDLRKIILDLSTQINSLQMEINHLTNRFGKSI